MCKSNFRPKVVEDYDIKMDWDDIEDDDIIMASKEKINNKLKIMNVATAMSTLGMANTRGLEDPSVGPMLLSHA